MFRTATAVTLFVFLIPTVPAKDFSTESPLDSGIPSGDTHTHRITQDYVQAQLDWRSYYLNRMAVKRDGLPPENSSLQQPPFAQQN